MCGAGCSAKYMCLTITVTYQNRQKKSRNATVFENESTLGKQVGYISRTTKDDVDITLSIQIPVSCHHCWSVNTVTIMRYRWQS